MPPKPQPKLQVGSPRARRTTVDDKTFEELSSRAEDAPALEGIGSQLPTSDVTPSRSDVSSSDGGISKREGRAPSLASSAASGLSTEPANRKGKSGEPYVRKSDGVPTVPQYLTLPTELVKRLKLHAVENDMKVSDVAAEAIAAYLDKH
jgi:hypothetical protein